MCLEGGRGLCGRASKTWRNTMMTPLLPRTRKRAAIHAHPPIHPTNHPFPQPRFGFACVQQALDVFVKSLLLFPTPRPEHVVKFLLPEEAMLESLNGFLKTNAQLNILNQNANIIAELNDSLLAAPVTTTTPAPTKPPSSSSVSSSSSSSSATAAAAAAAAADSAQHQAGKIGSAGSTPRHASHGKQQHSRLLAAAAECHPAASPSQVLNAPSLRELQQHGGGSTNTSTSIARSGKQPPSIDVAIPVTMVEQVTVLTTAYNQGAWVWGFGPSTHGGVRLLPRRAEYVLVVVVVVVVVVAVAMAMATTTTTQQ